MNGIRKIPPTREISRMGAIKAAKLARFAGIA